MGATASVRDGEAARGMIEEIALELREAGARRRPIDPVRDRLGPSDVDAAYAVQDENTRHGLAHGRRLVGRKIGLTSPAVQRQLGVDQPDFGVLFADMERHEGLPIDCAALIQPRIEAEVAVVLERDLALEQPSVADLARAIAFVAPALEIVDSRVRDWGIGITDTIADNASSGLYVLGGPFRRVEGIDFRALAMTMRRGEEEVSTGAGRACLGSPLNAVLWLAGEMVRRGRPLRGGDVILSGALGPMVSVRPGDVFTAIISGLGSVSAEFAGGGDG